MTRKKDRGDEWLAQINDWLWNRTTESAADRFGTAVWDQLEQCDDGSRDMPEHSFLPQLMLALTALDAIAKQHFPHADPDLEDEPYELFVSRMLAAMVLHNVAPSKKAKLSVVGKR